MVVESTTLMGVIPYIRMGASFWELAWPWMSVTWAYAVGAISGVAFKVYWVRSPWLSIHFDSRIRLPVSILTSMRAPGEVGMVHVGSASLLEAGGELAAEMIGVGEAMLTEANTMLGHTRRAPHTI